MNQSSVQRKDSVKIDVTSVCCLKEIGEKSGIAFGSLCDLSYFNLSLDRRQCTGMAAGFKLFARFVTQKSTLSL